MSTFKKHVGRIKNTDRRCVVVFMQIPGNEDNALIVDTDALPDRFHDALMDVVDSNEGQQNPHLNQLLARRILPDMGYDILTALHTFGFLRPQPIDNIVMYPSPNNPCPLRTIVDFMNGVDVSPEATTNLENRHLENQKSESQQASIDIALNVLRQADDLENEAAKKREKAYRLAPELRPRAEPPTPSPDVTETSAYVTPVATPEYIQEAPQSPNEHVDAVNALLANSGLSPVPEVPENVLEANEAIEVMKSYGYQVAEPVVDVEEYQEIDPTLPPDVQAALRAAQESFVPESYDYEDEIEGNQVDTSDDAVQAFLDRAAFREDRSDKEKWQSLQPKNPVGRPRKDGQPARPKDAPVPKKRGRPPKAKSNAKPKAKAKT